MVFIQNLIQIIYYVMAALIAISLAKSLFKRKKNGNWVYDIMYAYCLIPFVLRVLHIK
ncbi:MAG: hypothetical protein IAC42_05495 [Spirochaetes bacterium]|uniref:Uncharacterized protein n=1 Tax=Candidatus Aphodenecus pullistercoris TaxID=2840669 RepID=A0A9D9E8E0_9SPIR|nr:hypothetical protein [Candidatus Aphodenecus pullistercoris]